MIKQIQNSQLPDVSLQLLDEDLEPVDLTTASTVALYLVGKTITVNGACVIDDAANGLIHRPWLAGDTSVLGLYQLWVEIYWGARSMIWPLSDTEFLLILPAVTGTPPTPPATRAYSVFGEVSGAYVDLASDTWVTLFSVGNLAMAHQIKALTLDLDGTPTDPVFRISACPTGSSKYKIFPYDLSDPVTESELIVDDLIDVPKAYDYAIQVYCSADNGARAKVASLKRIELSGTETPALTKFTTVEGNVTGFVDADWVSVYGESSIASDMNIKSVKFDITGGTPTSPVFRIRVKVSGSSFEKVFPFGVSTSVEDGHEFIFDEMVQIPEGSDFDVQVYCTVANSSSAKAYLKKIVL